MPVQKSGRIDHMIIRVISGVQDVSYMKWLLFCLHLELKVCKDSLLKSQEEFMILFHQLFLLTLTIVSNLYYKLILKKDHLVNKFQNSQDLKKTFRARFFKITKSTLNTNLKIYLIRLGFQETLDKSLKDFLNLNIIVFKDHKVQVTLLKSKKNIQTKNKEKRMLSNQI